MKKTKAIILSHESAYSFWMRTDESFGNVPSRQKAVLEPSSARDLKHSLAELKYDPRVFGRLHLLTSNRGVASSKGNIWYHCCSVELPPSAYLRISDNVYVCAPWFCLAQLARTCSKAQLILRITDLCGIYAIHPETGALPRRSHKIATVEVLRTQLLAHREIQGAKAVLDALPYAAQDSRSPRESVTTLMLCLPYRYGGFGLPRPKLNEDIVPKSRAALMGQDWFEGDLCWPNAKIIIEYAGREYHQDNERDNRRRNDLEVLGWQVFFVFDSTLRNEQEFEKLARKIAIKLGHRVQIPAGWHERHLQLRSELDVTARYWF